MNGIKRRLAALGIATACTAGGVGLVPVSPASAASMSCRLTITDWWQDSRYERWEINCYNRPIGDQAEYVNFWGADPWYDENDFLYREYTGNFDLRWGTITDAQLNEDGNNEGDEIYAAVRVRRPNGTTYEVKTNTVSRNLNS